MINNNWGIFISGWGRLAIKTLELMEEGCLGSNRISLIIYESAGNGVFEIAERLGIPMVKIAKTQFDTLEEYYSEILHYTTQYNIDYIFLLGYTKIVKDPLLSLFHNKIVNIHPSLLPSFKGLRAIDQALKYGVKLSGITTHFITKEVDTGTILCQRCIKIEKGIAFEELDEIFVEEGKLIIEETFKAIQN